MDANRRKLILDMTTRLLLVVAAAAGAALAAGPAPARADDASYLARLNNSGMDIPMTQDVRLSTGHYLCGRLRVKATDADLVRELTHVFFVSPQAAVTQLDAAREEICPDTIRRR